MIVIPNRQTRNLAQNNRSKFLGYIWSSFGLDLLSDIATIKLSPRLRINTSGVTNQGRCVAIRAFDQRIFSICGSRIFKNSAQNLISPFTEDASASVQTDYDASLSDMDHFNSALVTTTTDAVYSKASNGSGTGAWTLRATLSATTGIHKGCYFQKYNRYYYLDGDNLIKSLSSSWVEATTGDYSLSLNNNYGIFYTLVPDTNDIWIGTLNSVPSNTLPVIGGSSILRWDGISQAVFEYKIKAGAALALCKNDFDGLIYGMDSNGCLLKFNGSGFSEIDRLPIDEKLLKSAVAYGYSNFIHPNGMTFTKNGTFKFLINNLVGDSGATVIENFPSGIWEWSKEKGFVHTNAASLSTLLNSDITDHGQNRVSAVGAIYEPNIYSESASGKPTLICGIDYYSDASTAVSGIFVDDPLNTLQKYGYIVSPWILSTNVDDYWQKLSLKYRQLLSETDKIIAKYRTTEATPTEISITWVNTTSFTTSTNVTALTGYEVEIIQGTGSGKCAHITTVTGSGPYTVNLDETFTGVTTGTAKARLQNWKKITTVADQTSESNQPMFNATGTLSSTRIQVKVCMQFSGEDEIFEIGIINKEHKPMS